jgi:hypothetical protein
MGQPVIHPAMPLGTMIAEVVGADEAGEPAVGFFLGGELMEG